MSQPHRLAADAAHQFGGIELDRSKPLQFRLNGRRIQGYAGDSVLSALLASGIDAYGSLGETTLGLSESFAPLVKDRSGEALPMARLPATEGLDLTSIGSRKVRFGRSAGLGHRIDGIADAPWLRLAPAETLSADLLVIGGGVAGLAAADDAASAGRSVILIERRPWLGGDARYFGPLGDEESPETVTNRLIDKLRSAANVTLLANAEAFALTGTSALVHRIEGGRGRVVSITATGLVLATGSIQRLPIMAGNRLPGVATSMAAYHLAKRYGVVHGKSAIVATQSNYGYRLAMRLSDAGIAVHRVTDVRINPQSRFVDFAKASGLTLSGGHTPVVAQKTQHGVQVAFITIGNSATSLELNADAMILSGPFQPDLALWMQAGGGTHWSEGKLRSRGEIEHVALAGAVDGYRSLAACVASGRRAASHLFGGKTNAIADPEIDAMFETPDAPNLIAPLSAAPPAFLDSGASLIARPVPKVRPALTTYAHAPSLGDVAASVELSIIAAADAGAVAEERGAPGGDLVASDWQAPPREPDELPPWLLARLGPSPVRLHLVVDGKRRFERGALVYANTSASDPALAIGVIVAAAQDEQPGGMALMSAAALGKADRFIVETLEEPSPARPAAAG
ncbi:MAG: FAD-dependent oxidoreductase [Hyphomicrobiales bacterium]|nr:MAG: FAD-dependent oxidoreductase [Hyphomicrobiales bacterium]